MPRFALYSWVTAEKQSEKFSAVYACDNGPHRPSDETDLFLREVVINGVGIEPYMTRLEEVLRGHEPWQWENLADLTHSLSLFSRLMRQDTQDSAALLHAAIEHRIPHLVTNIAKKHALGGGLRACPRFYHSTFAVME